MMFPDYFAQIPPLTLYDPLAEALGAAEGGLLTYRYEDAVRLAGHSCPTVAGAWLMAVRGLSILYPEPTIPERGRIRIDMRDPEDAGTTGVVANVLGLITGAAGRGGFKGLGGVHARRGLLNFGTAQFAPVRLTRLDTGAAVAVDYDPDHVPPSPDLPGLMARMVGGTADAEVRNTLAHLWRERVRRILIDHADDPDLVSAMHAE
jgi:hypothetical protein